MYELCEQLRGNAGCVQRRNQTACRVISLTFLCLSVLPLFSTPARAQHGDYLLGTVGMLGAQQPPEGVLYQNLWSYYTASDDGFIETGPVRCGPTGRLCLGAHFGASGSLDLFVDQNIFWLVTPFKIPFIDATYGALIDVPFAIAGTSGAASIQPVLLLPWLQNLANSPRAYHIELWRLDEG